MHDEWRDREAISAANIGGDNRVISTPFSTFSGRL